MDFNKMTPQELLEQSQLSTWTKLPFNKKTELFLCLKKKKVNNSSTRNLILNTIFTTDEFLDEFINLKKQLKEIITHAWGQRRSSIVQSILLKKETEWSEKELSILEEMLGRFISSQRQRKKLYNAVLEILSHK